MDRAWHTAFYDCFPCQYNPENSVTSEVSNLSEWKACLRFPEGLLIYIQSLSECVISAEDMLQGWWKVLRDEKHFMTDIDLSTRLEWLNSVGLCYEPPDCGSSQTWGQGCGRHPDSPLFPCGAQTPPGNALVPAVINECPYYAIQNIFSWKEADQVCNLCATHRTKRKCNLFAWANQLCWT